MRLYKNVLVLSALAIAAGPAIAGLPVEFPPGTDLDNNGANETEYSAIRQEFLAPAIGGRIAFDWQLFTSEFFGGTEDVAYVRLVNPADGSVVDSEEWAIDTTPAGYAGIFTPIGQPPGGTTASSQAVPGGAGLMFDAFHIDGGTGWEQAFLSIPSAATNYPLALEILVADTVDRSADTTLAIDNIRALNVQGLPIASLMNPSFESQLAGWTVEGNAGVQVSMVDLATNTMLVPGTGATDGKWYAVVSTGGQIPEPGSICIAAVGSAGLMLMVRRGAIR